MKSCTSVNDQTELVFSFVQILEFDDVHEVTQSERVVNGFKTVMEEIDLAVNNMSAVETAEVKKDEVLRSECRLKGLRLILFYLRQPNANLAHLLLGMDVKKTLADQMFYNPGKRVIIF